MGLFHSVRFSLMTGEVLIFVSRNSGEVVMESNVVCKKRFPQTVSFPFSLLLHSSPMKIFSCLISTKPTLNGSRMMMRTLNRCFSPIYGR